MTLCRCAAVGATLPNNIAANEKLVERHMFRLTSVAYLSLRIIEAIADGRALPTRRFFARLPCYSRPCKSTEYGLFGAGGEDLP
jgi:hypothetical protein